MNTKPKFCGHCGSRNVLANKYCNYCGKQFPVLGQFPEDGHDSEPWIPVQLEPIIESEEKIIREEREALPTSPVYYSPAAYHLMEDKLAMLIDGPGRLTISGKDGAVLFNREREDNAIQIIVGMKAAFSAKQQEILADLGFSERSYNLQRTLNYQSKQQGHNELVYISKVIFENVYHTQNPADLSFLEDFWPKTEAFRPKAPAAKRSLMPFKIAAVALILAISVSFGWKWFGTTVTTAVTVSNSPVEAYKLEVESFIKDNFLAYPDSYKSISWGKVTPVEGYSTFNYMITHKFSAKNNSGEPVVQQIDFYLDNDGNVVDYRDTALEK